MSVLPLSAAERARHAALSPRQVEWLDFVAGRPEALARVPFGDLGIEAGLWPERMQPWPLFLDRCGVAPMARAGIETMRLIETVPERVFGGDPDRLSEFYGLNEWLARAAVRLLADPACLGHLIGRGDFIRGPQGLACCEFNISGSLGGWQMGIWEEHYRSQPLIREFLAERGLRVIPLDPVSFMLEHAAEVGLARGLAAEGQLNLALLTVETMPPGMTELLGRRWREILAERAAGLAGEVVVCSSEWQLSWQGGRARFAGMPVQLFIDQVVELGDGPVFRAQAGGTGFSFDSLLTPMLVDKRNLALLSEQAEEGDLYDAGERAAIARLIPWTRLLADGFADRAGERVYLPDYARAERESLVIKPPAEHGGKDVYAGFTLSPAEWEARLDTALAEEGWVVQEFVPSETYLFQGPAGGAVPHDLVWGLFVFGERFGSCMLRGAPAGGGVVNVTRGGLHIVTLAVEEDGAGSSIESTCHEEPSDAP